MQSLGTGRDNATRASGADRLRNKTAREAIIHAIGKDFNLTPIIAEAYFSQVATYSSQHTDVTLATGQVCYEAVSASEPAGKHIALAARVSVRLTLFDPQVDLTVLAEQGLAGVHRHRILRMTREAIDQEALLSQLDLAMLLNVCDSVVSGYVNEYQNTSGRLLPTRGNVHDLSGHITHKREIVSLYLQGYDTPRIARKTRHAKESVDRYICDFESVDS